MNEYRVNLPNGFETTLLLDEEHKERDYPDAVPMSDVDAGDDLKASSTVKAE